MRTGRMRAAVALFVAAALAAAGPLAAAEQPVPVKAALQITYYYLPG